MNKRELNVLNILWKTEGPITSSDIVLQGEGLTQSTVTAVLRKLLNAELVESVGVTHSGKVLSRLFIPTEKSKAAVLSHFSEQYLLVKDVVTPEEIHKFINDKK